MNNRLIARIARQGGGKLLDLAVKRLFLARTEAEGGKPAKRSMKTAIAGAALTRIATRSVPGAIVIGGGILAKTLYDRRRERRAGEQGQTGESADGGA